MGKINNKKKKKTNADEMVRKVFKRSSGFMWGLLVNLVIVFFVIKLFSYSFNFAYGVFGKTAKNPMSRDYKLIEIQADSSIMQFGEALENAEIIKDKYVFWAKVKVKGYGDKIVAGKYTLCASMTYDEILEKICHIEKKTEEKKE